MKKIQPYQLKNFQEDVLDRSQQIPVLVDYWASWCGPCKFLEPIVEKLAAEAKGTWQLVKINTEEHNDIATEWGVRSIPNLKLFYKGKVIADLAGAMEEPDMRKWLTNKLPSEAKTCTMEASELIAKGEIGKGIELLENAIDLDETLNEARLLLAKLIVWKSPSRIMPLVQDIRHVEEAEELILLASFLNDEVSDLREGKSKELFIKVKSLLLDEQIDPAMQLLIDVLVLNKSSQIDLARKLTVAIFHTLGESNELTKKYRRQFDMALY